MVVTIYHIPDNKVIAVRSLNWSQITTAYFIMVVEGNVFALEADILK
jgi:hypothetical protein